MGRKIMNSLITLTGAGLTVLAVFAYELGVAKTPDWGPGRTVVAVTGLFLLFIAALLKFGADLGRWWKKRMDKLGQVPVVRAGRQKLAHFKEVWERQPAVRWARRSRLVRYFATSNRRRMNLAFILVAGIVLTAQVWFVSVGYWTEWPQTTTYTSRLSDAFLHGQVALLEEPSPSLLALEDPYQFENRQGVPYVWDAVLYNGKFYLYWGPVPALLLSAVRLFYRETIGDQFLVFGFTFGLWLFAGLLLMRLQRRFFPQFGVRTLLPGLLMLGLANPILWILNRPAVYEAAIMGGQFFLAAGLYFAFTGLDRERPAVWRLVLAGAFWILAAGCRVSVLGAGMFLVAVSGLWILRQPGGWRRKIVSLSALGAPFVLGAVGIGLYNYARFGSWFEFGFRYQLTGTNTQDNTFSFANFWINAYNYSLNLIKVSPEFPFLIPNWGGHLIFFPIPSTPNYYTEQISGVLLTTPYVWLAVLPLVFLLSVGWKWLTGVIRKTPKANTAPGFLEWTVLAVSGAGILSFAPILLFISATMRYLGDAVPFLILMSTLGVWLGMQYLQGKPGSQKWFGLFVALLVIASVLVSVLLTLTGCDNRLEKVNPAVYYQLFDFFSR